MIMNLFVILGITAIYFPRISLADVNEEALVPQAVIPVHWKIEIVDISKVNVENMDFRLDFNIRQSWTEQSLNTTGIFRFDNETSIALDDEILKRIWSPDFYVPNARQSAVESLRTSTSNALIYRNKTIIYTARLWVVLGCQMEFQWYPMDVQQCDLVIESYSYPMTQVTFEWAKIDPVIVLGNIKLLRYSIKMPLSHKSTVVQRFQKGEEYGRVSVLFTFQRLIGNQIIQTFLPTFLVVSLSWFSFWLGVDAVPGRISLLVTSMLTLVTMFSVSKTNLPPVAYIKMMDIWTITCMVFVFAAMSEFVIIKNLYDKSRQTSVQDDILDIGRFELENYGNYPRGLQQTRSDKGKAKMKFLDNQLFHRSGDSVSMSNSTSTSRHILNTNLFDRKRVEIWQRIDRVSKVAFPILFFSFTIIYVPVLVIGSGNEMFDNYSGSE